MGTGTKVVSLSWKAREPKFVAAPNRADAMAKN